MNHRADTKTPDVDSASAERTSAEHPPPARPMSRRRFLGAAATAGLAAAAAPMIVPRHVIAGPGYQAPSDTVNIGGVGIGGVGQGKIERMATTANVAALCDVDSVYAADVFEQYPDAQRYEDYRQMLDEMESDLDGVVVATPDHTHAVIAIEAMERGLAVYVEKPLTWSVAEARRMVEVAESTGVVTQMGNQGHSSNDARLVNEYVRDGALGPVREVLAWTNRPIWPQGIDHPDVLKRTPQTLNWDLFLGPAPDVPYDPAYHPFSWRGWVDYGTGALGDMGAHLLDHPYWALELGDPTSVETRATGFNGASWPHATITHYDFPARTIEGAGAQPPVRLTWYDGGLMPPRPEELPDEEQLNPTGGVIFVGDEGKLMHETYGSNPRLLPTRRMDDYPEPPELFPRIADENHEQNWVRAIRGEEEATSDFRYAAKLTEVMLLGIVSLRAGGRKLMWDAEAMEVTNLPEANQYLSRQNPREGWAV